MDWQGYQDAVGELYAQLQHGNLQKNVYLSDRNTGRKRQVDAWVTVPIRHHVINILIDAKFHKRKVDVKKVEEIYGLAEAVGADKTFIVCSNGWTKAAKKKAFFYRMDLELLTIEEAVKVLNPDAWKECAICNKDCIIMNHDGTAIFNNLVFWWIAGTCRACGSARIWCQDCGDKVFVKKGESYTCNCGHMWNVDNDGISLLMNGHAEKVKI